MQFLQKIIDIIFPPDCLVCEEEGDILCNNCQEKLPRTDHLRHFSTELFQKIFVFGEYDNPALKQIIHQMKYGYAKELGEKLRGFFEKNFPYSFFPKNLVFVPVPLHFLRQNERGFNQSDILADIFLEIVGEESQKQSLIKRTRNTPHQAGLSKKEREENVQNAFEVRGKINDNKNYILVDDVASTLSTLNECAKVLKTAGAKNIYAIVIATGN